MVRHGHNRRGQRSRAYTVWVNMHCRCKPTYHQAYDYFERGIVVCERWFNFDNFLSDMGEPGVNQTIDRKNNNGIYEPSNCRWVNRVTQNRNRRNSVEITYQGKTQCLKAWCVQLGLSYRAVYLRYYKQQTTDPNTLFRS